MAKEMNAAQVAEWLKSQGLAIPEELNAKVENSVQDEAARKIQESLVPLTKKNKAGEETTDEVAMVKSAGEWQANLFEQAGFFSERFKGQEKNVGQGRVFERSIEITLADGSKYMIRHREPREKK